MIFEMKVEIDTVVLNFDQKFIRYIDSSVHKSMELTMDRDFQISSNASTSREDA